MSSARKQTFIRNPSTHRLSSLRNDITIMWLTNRSSLSKHNLEMVTGLQSLHDHTFLYYTKISNAIKYVNRAKHHEYLIVVVDELDPRLCPTIFPKLQQSQKVQKILTSGYTNNDLGDAIETSRNLDKIVICQKHESLSTEIQQILQNAIMQIENDSIFTTLNVNEKALRDVRHELGLFAWGYCNVCKCSTPTL